MTFSTSNSCSSLRKILSHKVTMFFLSTVVLQLNTACISAFFLIVLVAYNLSLLSCFFRLFLNFFEWSFFSQFISVCTGPVFTTFSGLYQTYGSMVFRSLKGCCYRLGVNQQNCHTPPSFFARAFHNRLDDHNTDEHINTVDDPANYVWQKFGTNWQNTLQ